MRIQCHETVTVYTVLLYNVRYHHAVIVHTVSLYAMYIVTIQCSYSVIKHTCDSAQCHYIRVQYTVYIILYIIIIQCDSAATQCQYIYMYTGSVSITIHCALSLYSYTHIDMHVVQYIIQCSHRSIHSV